MTIHRGLMASLVVSAFGLVVPLGAWANPGMAWEALTELPQPRGVERGKLLPQAYAPFRLNREALEAQLLAAPMEDGEEARFAPLLLAFPTPEGQLSHFEVVESPIMAPELAAKYPEIKTYLGQGVEDPTTTVRFSVTPIGFHAQVLSERGTIFVNPAFDGETDHYVAYHIRDDRVTHRLACSTDREHQIAPVPAERGNGEGGERAITIGPQRRTFRAAIAATGEFSFTYGNDTVAGGLAAVVMLMNRVNHVYENEASVRMVLVPNNDLLIYTFSVGDPYTNGNNSLMLGENPPNVNSIIGSANYDIGHVFGTGGGGVAYLGVVCSGLKAGGVSSVTGGLDQWYSAFLVTHEMGHQFNAPHSFNSSSGGCADNWDPSGSYEPGAGTTPMGYVNVCPPDEVQDFGDFYFHSGSFDRITAFLECCTSCASITATGNQAPTNVVAGPAATIPSRTAFVLNASATDPDGDLLTYCWEQRDLGPQQTLTDGDNGQSPIFRTFLPTSNTSRMLPNQFSVLTGALVYGERYPTASRAMGWRVTVRDNRAGNGGVGFANTVVNIVGTAGPFRVTAPNGNVTWSQTQTVLWDVAGTNAPPINTANVRIELSTDGGQTFPTVLAASTPNDGSHEVQLPEISTNLARIRISATNSIYFDVSDANFQITPFPVPAPFALLTPANTSINVPLQPTFSWNVSQNATGYRLEVDTDSNFTLPLVYSVDLAGLSHVPPGGVLGPSQQYTWRVLALNSFGETVSGPLDRLQGAL